MRPQKMQWFAAVCLALALSSQSPAASPTDTAVELLDITSESGITFQHDNGRRGEWHYPEIVGGGCGMLDYDNDGLLDLVFIQSGALPRQPADADPPDRSATGGTRLYRNITANDSDVRFRDVTEEAGLATKGYGTGVATGDLTGNGHVDLYITNFGPNTLWRNNGDGTFTDITPATGAGNPGFSTSAAAADFNLDGRLDLYVVNYVHYDPTVNPKCYAPSTRRDYCGPAVFPPQDDALYLGSPDGEFRDASASLRGGTPRRGLGVVVADFDGDKLPDIYVANDGEANLMWRGQGEDGFREHAWPSGTAVNRDGQMEAGMGVEAADLDGDGMLDLLLTHLTGESNTYYRNRGGGLFEDDTAMMGLGASSLPYTGFGAGALDLDLDGRLDLFIANGAVRVIESQRQDKVDYPLREPDLVFHNRDGGGFRDISDELREALGPPLVGRGAAVGDINNNGREDVLVCNSDGPPRLLLSGGGTGRHWIGIRATTGDPPRDALGATVALLENGVPDRLRRIATDGSYLSASDPRAVIGLGGDERRRRDILVTWPGGDHERFTGIPANTYTTIHRGEGETWHETD